MVRKGVRIRLKGWAELLFGVLSLKRRFALLSRVYHKWSDITFGYEKSDNAVIARQISFS